MPSIADTELARRFGTYILPGRANDPKRGIAEAAEAERLGLGAIWLSERYAAKEPAVLSGAVAQATSRIRIAGTMYCQMRHPIVTASVANVVQALSGNRFELVLARAVKPLFDALGAPPITFARLGDFISIFRRLLAGEKVSYEGVLGRFPALQLADLCEAAIPPIIFTAMGPKSLAFAGSHCDGVLLHPFLTPEGAARSAAIVHEGAERAGRDPRSVRIILGVVVAPDLTPEEEDQIVAARAVSYFQLPDFGEILVEANGWNMAALEAFRAQPVLAPMSGAMADQVASRNQLVEASRGLPRAWLTTGAAIGTAAQCAKRLCTYLDAGVDEIVLHGSAPNRMGGLVEALKPELARRAPRA